MASSELKANGWSALPINAKDIASITSKLPAAKQYDLDDIKFPSDDPLVVEAWNFVKCRLSERVFNHSMRVYYWGIAIAERVLPEHVKDLSRSTWALTCLLHDIGTAEEFFATTRMSFDIYGGIKALEVIKAIGGQTDQAEAVAEAIIRHQDVGVDGTITFLGQLIQLATLYDNVGVYEGVENFGALIHQETLDTINKAFPRKSWSHAFASTVRQEESNKPWCHSTHIVNFEEMLESNTLMAAWD